MPNPPAAPDRGPLSATYLDRGCHCHPSCLSCPLPVCILDDPHAKQRAAIPGHRRHLLHLMKRGYTVEKAAPLVGISRRTAYRLLCRVDKLAQTH